MILMRWYVSHIKKKDAIIGLTQPSDRTMLTEKLQYAEAEVLQDDDDLDSSAAVNGNTIVQVAN